MALSFHNLIREIRQRAKKLQNLPDEQLKIEGLTLKHDAMCGVSVKSLMLRGFPLVVEASRRTLGLVPYDVQIQCAIQMMRGRIAEMKTGEGKTLTAAMPTFLNALIGQGVHVVTANDYLAKRDCELIRPIYQLLGLTADYLAADDEPQKRMVTYRKDITYGSAKEFGFDFLRDRLKRLADRFDRSQLVMRPLAFALVDEADSILIDEARTPLIIGMIDQEEETISNDCFRWAAEFAAHFDEERDFKYDHKRQKVELTLSGRSLLRQLPQRHGTKRVSIHDLYEYIENAIKVRRDYQLDKNYAIVDEKIMIIDEFTGRPAEGRQWQRGVHQSVEAKEQLPITPATRQAATITIQSFFQKYRRLAGMTGTAWTSRREFKKVFKKKVVRIPTHRPVRRTQLPPKIFATAQQKFETIAADTKKIIQSGRAVLIGTRSVEKSELLSQILARHEIQHSVLNAKQLEKEADIVALAGNPNSVTVATNMAGRGTDIKLADSVRENGGLHVILTEIHESQRIDWQLIGRGSRQGDPGSYRIYLSLEDEILLLGFGPQKREKIKKAHQESNELSPRLIGLFRQAQRKIETRHLVDRMILLRQDKERRERQFESGSDPYLDTVE